MLVSENAIVGNAAPWEQAIRHLGAEIRAAFGDSAQGIKQIAIGGAFEDEGSGAAANGTDNGVLVVVHRQHDDFHVGTVAQNFSGRFHTVEAWQADVHQNDMGS